MKLLDSVTTISFDGDATLWDFEKVMHHALGVVLEELSQHLPDELLKQLSIEGMISTRDTVAREFEGSEVNLEKIRLLSFQRTLTSIGVEDEELARHINDTYMKHRFEDIERYPDVIEAFKILSHDFVLGLLSNGNTYPECCGLGNIFKFAVFAQDYGVAKPDRRLFDIALDEADCSADELLHVGDSLINDVAGAQNAGIKAVWLNRAKALNNSNIQPDFEVADLMELVSLLKEGRTD